MSHLTDTLLLQIRAGGLPPPIAEYRFAPPRRWRFDFAYLAAHLAIEVEGGIHAHGRHTRGVGFEADCAKYNAATLAGWRVLRFTSRQIEDLSALETIRAALATPPAPRWPDADLTPGNPPEFRS